MKVIFILIICLIILMIALYVMFNERRPSDLGVRNGVLSACPSTPNCVSSQSNDTVHTIPPLIYNGEENPIEILARILRKYPKSRIITQKDSYMHVEFRSNFFSFVDDAEFYYDKPNGVVHIRSAARMGYYDLGVNRKRALGIEEKFKAMSKVD